MYIHFRYFMLQMTFITTFSANLLITLFTSKIYILNTNEPTTFQLIFPYFYDISYSYPIYTSLSYCKNIYFPMFDSQYEDQLFLVSSCHYLFYSLFIPYLTYHDINECINYKYILDVPERVNVTLYKECKHTSYYN